jgi:hypothetical protein
MFNALMGGMLFWVILGITVAINIVLLILTPFTATFGCLIGLAIGLISAVVISALGGDSSQKGKDEGITANMGWNAIMSFVKGFSPEPLGDENGGGTRAGNVGLAVCWGILSFVLGIFGTWTGAVAYVAVPKVTSDKTGTWPSIAALICGSIACVLSFIALVALAVYDWANVITFAALIFGVLAVVFSLYAASITLNPNARIIGYASAILGGLSIAAAAGSLLS